RAPGTKLHHVIVALHEWDHANQENVLCPLAQFVRLHTDTSDQKLLPLVQAKKFSPAIKRRQHVALRNLNLPECFNAKWPAVTLIGNSWVVSELNFRVEASRQHPFIAMHEFWIDSYVFKLQTRQLC